MHKNSEFLNSKRPHPISCSLEEVALALGLLFSAYICLVLLFCS